MEENKKNKIPNVPNLRFSKVPYCLLKVKDVCDVVSGGTPDTTNPKYWDGDINWFTPTEVGKTKYVKNSCRKITQQGYEKSGTKMLKSDSILLSTRATIGEESICKSDCCTNQGFQSLTNFKCNNEYLYYFFQTRKIRKSLIRRANGSTFLEISNYEVGATKLFLPSRDEQNKVALFLSLIDKRIETQNKIIDKCKSLIKCICDSAEMSANRQLKDIANYNPSNVKESVVNHKGKYPVFGAAGICGYLDDYIFSKAGIAIVKDGAGVGRLLKIKNDKYSILGTMGLIEAKNDIPQDYLWLALKMIKFKKYIVGSGIPHIYFSDYSSAQIPTFTNKNLIKAKLCSLLLDKIKINKDVLDKYLKQKIFLLNNLFI